MINKLKKFSKISVTPEKLDGNKILHNQYYYENNYLFYISADESGELTLSWLSNYLALLKVIENEDTGHFKYELELTTVAGKRIITVDKLNITARRFDTLTANGFTFDEKYTSRIIQYILLSEDYAEKIFEYSYSGFRDNKLWGYHEIGKRYVGNLKLESSENYNKDRLNELLNDSPNLQFSLIVGASTGVIGYLGQKLPLTTNIVHFWGDTSKGKTTALLTAISVWGKPTTESGLLSTWNQTENSLMSNKLANNYIAPVALDESSLCKYDLTSAIYNISQGINRQRLKKDATPATTAKWLTTVISSGESPLLEHTNQNSGLKVRCFDFNLQITKSAEHANDVKAFVLQNYGSIGKEIITNLEESDFSEIEEAFQEKRLEFLEVIPKSERLPITNRIADTYAIWLLTADFLQQLDVNVDYDIILEIIKNHHKQLELTYDLANVVHNVIMSRVASKRVFYPERTRFFGYDNVEGLVSGEYVIIIATVFEKILRDNGFNDRLLCLRSLYKADLLRKQRNDTYYCKSTINNVSVKCVAIKIKNHKEDNLYEV